MNEKEFTEQFVFEKGSEVFGEGVKLVEQGSWETEHKSAFCDSIYSYGSQFFRVTQQRDNCGYWSDGESYDPDVTEVVPQQKTVTVWVDA